MTSRPLFIKVAESIVTFGPIDQLGCLSAASSVALRISSFDQVRNGPPEAVMMTLVTSSRRPAVIAWNSALCSQSTGSTVAPVSLRAAHEQRAGADQAFLVGERERRAALDRGERRLEPGRAGDRADHPFGRAARRFGDRVGTGRRLDAAPGKFRLQLAIGVVVGDRRKARAEFARELAPAPRRSCARSAPRR